MTLRTSTNRRSRLSTRSFRSCGPAASTQSRTGAWHRTLGQLVILSTSSTRQVRRFQGWYLSRPCRSEEHTSELQLPCNLACRLLLEKKKKKTPPAHPTTTHPTVVSGGTTLHAR